jgi:hypothetical protein
MRRTLAAACVMTAALACATAKREPVAAGVDANGRPLPVQGNNEGKGVSLTGEHAYDDRYDPSGWSGKTAPTSFGGGPTAPAPAPSPSAAPLPPSKELDTSPPSKELQF